MSEDRREFWIMPRLGLCNRMQALLSAVAYSEHEDRELVICWCRGRVRRSRKPSWAWGSWSNSSIGDRCSVRLTDLWRHPYREVSAPIWLETAGLPDARMYYTDENPPEHGAEERIAMVSGGNSFCGTGLANPAEYLSRFELHPELREWYECEAVECISESTVGVSVRSVYAWCPPDFEWFFARMHEFLAQDPETQFFLSADSQAAELCFYREFGRRIRRQSRQFPYGSAMAMKKAVVDLYLLGGTRHILGSAGSSFSRMAWRISRCCDPGVPFETPEIPAWKNAAPAIATGDM